MIYFYQNLPTKKKIFILLITYFFTLFAPFSIHSNNKNHFHIFHIEPHAIDQMEDDVYAAFLDNSFNKAEKEKSDLILLEINTPGGELHATLKIKDIILSSPIKTICFVNTHAISAGSLIALSCEKIYMAPGGVIGAATPITTGSKGMEKASEKVISATRAAWRATATARNKNPDIAEAFVDESIVLTKKKHGINKPSGKLLTLTSDEALDMKISDGTVKTIRNILKKEIKGSYTVSTQKPDFGFQFLGFLLHPIISGIFITLGFLGILYEIKAPGWGIPGTMGIIFLSIYFLSRISLGLSGWGAPALFAFGIFLLILEIFVIPGFGFTGIIGIISMVAAILWSYGIHDIYEAGWVVAISFIAIITGIIAFFRYLPHFASRTKSIFLNENLQADLFDKKELQEFLIGKTGHVINPLRPSGIVEIEGKKYDAVSDADYIESGNQIKVTECRGLSVKVIRV